MKTNLPLVQLEENRYLDLTRLSLFPRERIDLDRVPQVIYEANCLTSHSCRGLDSSLETLPITLKMPVLMKNTRCASYSLEYEAINIACICATSRQSLF